MCGAASVPQLTCSPCGVRFGAVPMGQTETAVIALTNNGQTTVTVSAFKLQQNEFRVFNLTLPLVLAAGQSASLNVTFSPDATGWIGEQITLTSNASNPQLQLELEGAGLPSSSVSASPASVSFGQVSVGAKSTLPVVLTNSRSASIKISEFQMTGTGFSVSGPNLPVTLSPGQSITLNLTYAPLSQGTNYGNLIVTGPDRSIPLNGSGTPNGMGQLTISPALVNFGDVTVGTTGIQPITMSAAKQSVTVSSDASSSSQFVLEGASFPFTIPAGQSVSFHVAFTPTGTGTVSGSLSFTSNASETHTKESVTGIGTPQVFSVNLFWDASNDVVGYNVYRSLRADGNYHRINPSLDPTTAYTDSTVTSGHTYYYEATSVNSSGQESARSTPPVVANIP
jgi:Abnormal spindle-like microcephaly-assoc'd, ASPM-SPD-2-Hydin